MLITSAIKRQTSVCYSTSLNPHMVSQTWKFGITGKKKKSNSIVNLYC